MVNQLSVTSATLDGAFRRILDSIKQLPSPPEICLAVTEAARNETTTLLKLQELAESDIALSARLLQVANSAFFGVRGRVTSVRRAISLLGFATVETLALGFFFNDEFGKLRLPGLPYPDLPRYALASSVLADAIARRAAPELTAEAASLGLLHESGVIVLAMAFGGQYRQMVASLAHSDKPLWELERKTFGLDHAAAGRLLLQGWKLAEPLTIAVAAHHEPAPPEGDDRTARQLWQILVLASAAANMFLEDVSQENVERALDLAQRYFRWDHKELGAVLGQAELTFKARSEMMKLSSPARDGEGFFQRLVAKTGARANGPETPAGGPESEALGVQPW
jgi:HD-like signal output (HDOD) protein